MSDEFQYTINNKIEEIVILNLGIIIKIIYGSIIVICALLSYCCCRRRNTGTVLNTGTILSRPVEDSSYSNATLIPPTPLPPPRTSHYQAPHIQPPQPASNAPSASDASDLPPSYDQIFAKQTPYNHAAH